MKYFHIVSNKKFLSHTFHHSLHQSEYKKAMACMPPRKTATIAIYIQLALLLEHLYQNRKKTFKFIGDKKHTPYIIGINGSVSSGKSTFAQYLAALLRCLPNKPKVSVLSTDDFIYSNKVLKKKGLMAQKGHPVSYRWPLLFASLQRLKENKRISIQQYNQQLSDIDPRKKMQIQKNQEFIIVEGINLLKPTCQEDLDLFLLSDYLDYSIYIATKEKNLRYWFYKRLTRKAKLWKKRGIRKDITRKNRGALRTFSNKIWRNYNKVNLLQFIRPYKYRADLIITQDRNHQVKSLAFKV